MAKTDILLPSGELTVHANEEKNLPSLTNASDKKIALKIQAEGLWTYGSHSTFGKQVDANGNSEKTPYDGNVRFPNLRPATLVAMKNNQPVASGKEQTIELTPGETISFINNDAPGIYGDNKGSLKVKWSIASVKSSNGTAASNNPSNGGIKLPTGELTVLSTEEKNLPSLTNKSDKTIVVKIQAEGEWNYGPAWVLAKLVNGDGNSEWSSREPYMRFKEFPPAALVAVKNNQAVASGKEQTIELKSGETVSFINNDEPGYYNDNTGSLTIKWSIASIG